MCSGEMATFSGSWKKSVTFLVWPSMCLATLWPSTGFCIGSSITWSSLYCGRRMSSTWCKLLWLNFIFPTPLSAFSASSFHHAPSGKSLLLVQRKVKKQLGSAFLTQAFWQSWPLAGAWELGFGEVPIISYLILSLCLNCLYKWCGLCCTPVSVQFSHSVMSYSLRPHECSTPGLPVHHQLLESTQTHVHWVGDAIQPSHLCRPLLLLPSIFPSIRVFSKESALRIRWPKYWSFCFHISPYQWRPRTGLL